MKAELRFFVAGGLPAVLRKELSGPGSFRTDRYLSWCPDSNVSVKQRHAGSSRSLIESKALYRQWPETAGAVEGICQQWEKTPRSGRPSEAASGVQVSKRRWRPGVGLEVVELEIDGEQWWTAAVSSRTSPTRKQLAGLGRIIAGHDTVSCSYPQLVFGTDRATLQLAR